MISKFIKYVFCTISIIFLLTNLITAQGIAFDYGISGAQNYGEPNSTFGFSLIMPFSKNIEGVLSYYQWRGEDDNYTFSKKDNVSGNSPMTGKYYGNKGMNFLINYRYYSFSGFSFLVGGGFSQFEMLNVYDNEDVVKEYVGAITIVPLFIKKQLSKNIGIYLRGTLSAKVTRFVPDWGIINIGLELKPFE